MADTKSRKGKNNQKKIKKIQKSRSLGRLEFWLTLGGRPPLSGRDATLMMMMTLSSAAANLAHCCAIGPCLRARAPTGGGAVVLMLSTRA